VVLAQDYLPPDQFSAKVTKGLLRGASLSTRLKQGRGGTVIEETYLIPLPDWPLLGSLVRPWFIRRLGSIWGEDLRVGLCHGGRPGVPEE
jgi:hypothetical protein